MDYSEWLGKLKVGDKAAVRVHPIGGSDAYYATVISRVTKAQIATDFCDGRFRRDSGQSLVSSGPYDIRDRLVELTPDVIVEINKRIFRSRVCTEFNRLRDNIDQLSVAQLRRLTEFMKTIVVEE